MSPPPFEKVATARALIVLLALAAAACTAAVLLWPSSDDVAAATDYKLEAAADLDRSPISREQLERVRAQLLLADDGPGTQLLPSTQPPSRLLRSSTQRQWHSRQMVFNWPPATSGSPPPRVRAFAAGQPAGTVSSYSQQTQQQPEVPTSRPGGAAFDVDEAYRIVGGWNSPPSRFKWFCSVRSATNNAHFCGCSLIAPNLILTAAHCLAQESRALAYPNIEVGR
jgi:hypothetical protein